MPRVLVACEVYQTITEKFRNVGIEAYSCDIEPCCGGYPEWHLQQDVIPLLKEKWDMILAFPPCQYLTSAGNGWKSHERDLLRKNAADFFMEFINADCKYISVENPVGYMNKAYRKPDQIVHPYYFGDPVVKRTCLWLKGLPKLEYDKNSVLKPIPTYCGVSGKFYYFVDSSQGNFKKHKKYRSRTFDSIATAMVDQWSPLILG